jgi:hypothetical protein
MEKKTKYLGKLLKDTPEACYWAGFIVADGCLRINGDGFSPNEIKIALGEKDLKHLNQFKEFVGYVGKSKKAWTAYDSVVVEEFSKKYGVGVRKTYHGNLFILNNRDDLFLSFLIGFIDGDGNINRLINRPDTQINIKCHSSWLKPLNDMRSRIQIIFNVSLPIAKINNQGYARWTISNSRIVRILLETGLKLKLPIMDRKWGKINKDYISREEISIERKREISNLVDKHGISEIAFKMGINPKAVSSVIYRDKNLLAKYRNRTK